MDVKRLPPFLAELVPALERHGGLTVALAVRERLLGMRASTIDRLRRRSDCPTIRVGDYVVADGTKETEQHFLADTISVERREPGLASRAPRSRPAPTGRGRLSSGAFGGATGGDSGEVAVRVDDDRIVGVAIAAVARVLGVGRGVGYVEQSSHVLTLPLRRSRRYSRLYTRAAAHRLKSLAEHWKP
jgi:hypothetical protein